MGNMIGIHQQAGVIAAYIATPPPDVTCRGAVLVAHDIWGLTDHTKSVADRLATAGYYALAPELLFMTTEKQKLAAQIQTGLKSGDHIAQQAALEKFHPLLASTQTPQFTSLTLSRLGSCFEYLYNMPVVRRKVAVVGFGFGGTYAYSLAVREPRLRAAVPFYGHAGYVETELRHIACPVLAFYGGHDGVAPELKTLVPHMARVGVRFTPVVYDNAHASFFDETNKNTYISVAADDAWHRLVSFLRVA